MEQPSAAREPERYRHGPVPWPPREVEPTPEPPAWLQKISNEAQVGASEYIGPEWDEPCEECNRPGCTDCLQDEPCYICDGRGCPECCPDERAP
jgi:hypothetical protein